MEFDIQGVLFPNLITMIVQLLSTIVLFLLVKKLLWKPAREILKKRQEKIDADLANAEKIQADALNELNEAKQNLETARNKSNEIIDEARKEANNLRQEIVSSAKKEAADKLKDAERNIEQKKIEASNQIHDEMVNVALAAVSKLLNDKSQAVDDEKAIKEYINEVKDKKWP